MKTTFIVDTLMILGTHMTVTRKHDTQIILPLFHKVRKGFRIRCCLLTKDTTTRR